MNGVAAVIVNWNGGAILQRCLTSLFNGTVPPDLTILVDNGSQDGSPDQAMQWPHLQLVRNTYNVGFAAANNQALRLILEDARWSYAFLINTDAFVQRDCLACLLAVAQQDPQCGLVVPHIVFDHDPRRAWYAGGFVDWKQGSGKHRQASPPPGHIQEVTFATACALLIPRTTLECVGLFDERYFAYEEDVDFSLRVQAAGLRILYVPHARVSHQVHASTRHRGWAIPYYFLSRNRLLTMRTYGRPATYALFVPYFAALWTWKVLGFLTRRDWLAAQAMVRGLRDGLVGRFGPPPPDLLG